MIEPDMNPKDLWLEEIFTDRRVGTIRRMTPVDGKGERDPGREVMFVGETQVMSQLGALPINFVLEAKTLEEAAKLFGGARLGMAGPLALRLLQRTVGARVAKQLPPFALETIRGIAEGAGIPYESMLEGCTMPDTVLWAASRVIELKRARPAMAHRLALGLGCTSAIAWGRATRDGKLLHARNLDYHGVSCWPKTQTVFSCEPDEGQRYVSVAAAGVGWWHAARRSARAVAVVEHAAHRLGLLRCGAGSGGTV